MSKPRISVSFAMSYDFLDRIDKVRGQKSRSEFVREAIEYYLKEGQK